MVRYYGQIAGGYYGQIAGGYYGQIAGGYYGQIAGGYYGQIAGGYYEDLPKRQWYRKQNTMTDRIRFHYIYLARFALTWLV